jgi:hypothetical protein
VSEIQRSNEETQQDPTIGKIDEIAATLARWRAVLLQIGDPTAAQHHAAAVLRALLPAFKEDRDIARGFLRSGDAEYAEAIFRAAATRRQIDEDVARLHGALSSPEQSEGEIRDRVDRYLVSLLEKLWIVKKVPGADRVRDALKITPETVADDMIAALTSRWPEHGARLKARRPALLDRLTKLQTRGRGHPPKGMEKTKTADKVREEILGWIFESADREAVRQHRKRARK